MYFSINEKYTKIYSEYVFEYFFQKIFKIVLISFCLNTSIRILYNTDWLFPNGVISELKNLSTLTFGRYYRYLNSYSKE